MKTSLSLVTELAGVSRETLERLHIYAELLAKWQNSINLVAASTLPDLWDRHIADSLQVYRLCPEDHIWADFGSGAGFPGLITGLCLAEHGHGWVHLVESNSKKAAFLRTVIGRTGARASVHCQRIETLPQQNTAITRISARALADMDSLLSYIEPWAARVPELVAYVHKGRDYRSEVAISNRRWIFDLVEHPSLVDRDSVVLEIRNLARRPI